MSDIIVGYTDRDDYVYFGKLSDGTPVYKHTPPAQPDPSILHESKKKKDKLIGDYNKSTEIRETDTAELMQNMVESDQRDLQKEIRRQEIKLQTVVEDNHTPVSPSYNPPRKKDTTVYTSQYVNTLIENEKKKNKKHRSVPKKSEPLKETQHKSPENLSSTYEQIADSKQQSEKEKIADEKYKMHLDIVSAYSESRPELDVIEEEIIDEAQETVEESKSILDLYDDVKSNEPLITDSIERKKEEKLEKYHESIQEDKEPENADLSILDYYKQVTAKRTEGSDNPEEYLDSLHTEEDKETAKEEFAQKVEKQKQGIIEEEEQKLRDRENIPAQSTTSDDVIIEETNPEEYLDLLNNEEDKDLRRRDIKLKAQEQRQRDLQEFDNHRAELQEKYNIQLARLNAEETRLLKLVEDKIRARESELITEYTETLKETSVEYDDFYNIEHEYDVTTNIEARTVTVTNLNTRDSHTLEYRGNLIDVKLTGYQLKLASMIKEDISLMNMPQAKGFVTHVQTVYDIRDRSVVDHLTFTFNKFDATLLEENAADDVMDADTDDVSTTRHGTAMWSYIPSFTHPTSTIVYNTSAEHPLFGTEMQDETSNYTDETTNLYTNTNINTTSGSGELSNILLERLDGGFGRVQVNYCTLDGESSNGASNATAGTDYTGVTGQVTWDHLETGAKALTGITVLEDFESEAEDKTFFIYLSSVAGLPSTPHRDWGGSESAASERPLVRPIGTDVNGENQFYFGLGTNMARKVPITIRARHHGFFTFTTGIGSSTCPKWVGWNSGYSNISAVAPDGIQKGFVTIGVERLSGTHGAVTLRYLVSAGIPSFAYTGTGTNPFPYGLINTDTGDYIINYSNAPESFENETGSGAYNYAQEATDSEVAITSAAGVTYSNDPLSASLQTLTWAHGEGGIKYIKLHHSALGNNNATMASQSHPTTNTFRWYAVYLTFDHSLKMGLSASTTPITTSWRYGNTIVPTACATIANLAHGRVDNSHNNNLSTGWRGGSATPFFVAISGFESNQAGARDEYCYSGPY